LVSEGFVALDLGEPCGEFEILVSLSADAVSGPDAALKWKRFDSQKCVYNQKPFDSKFENINVTEINQN